MSDSDITTTESGEESVEIVASSEKSWDETIIPDLTWIIYDDDTMDDSEEEDDDAKDSDANESDSDNDDAKEEAMAKGEEEVVSDGDGDGQNAMNSAFMDALEDGYDPWEEDVVMNVNSEELMAELLNLWEILGMPTIQRIMTEIFEFVYGYDPLDGVYPDWNFE